MEFKKIQYISIALVSVLIVCLELNNFHLKFLVVGIYILSYEKLPRMLIFPLISLFTVLLPGIIMYVLINGFYNHNPDKKCDACKMNKSEKNKISDIHIHTCTTKRPFATNIANLRKKEICCRESFFCFILSYFLAYLFCSLFHLMCENIFKESTTILAPFISYTLDNEKLVFSFFEVTVLLIHTITSSTILLLIEFNETKKLTNLVDIEHDELNIRNIIRGIVAKLTFHLIMLSVLILLCILYYFHIKSFLSLAIIFGLGVVFNLGPALAFGIVYKKTTSTTLYELDIEED